MKLNSLQPNLSSEMRKLNHWKSQIKSDLVMQKADEIIELAGEPLRDLIMAVISKNGKDSGFTGKQKTAFIVNSSTSILDEIVARLFDSKGFPDLGEAEQHVKSLIEAA